MLESLKESLQDLNKKRKALEIIENNLATIKADYTAKIDKIKQDTDYQNLTVLTANLENQIKEKVLQEYQESDKKSKQLDFGLKVQERKVIDYKEEEAFEWAKEHKLCLSLDKKSFEKLAEIQKFDFVTFDKKEIITVPKELKLED